MGIITQILGMTWCLICLGCMGWCIAEYIVVKNKKL